LRNKRSKILFITGCFLAAAMFHQYIQIISAGIERTYVDFRTKRYLQKFPSSLFYNSAIDTDLSVFFHAIYAKEY